MTALARVLIFCCLVLFSSVVSFESVDAAPHNNPVVVKAGVERAFGGQDRVRVLIKLKEDPQLPGRLTSRSRIKHLQSRFRASFSNEEQTGDILIARQMHRIPWISAKISRNVLEKLRHHKHVAVVEEDIPIHARLTESVPQIKADQSFHTGYTGMGVNVAVVDTGIDTDHPDLINSVVWEECFLSEDPCPVTGTDRASGLGSAEDNSSHGSHVSGIITSDNETFRGIAPDAGIVAIKILDGGGNGTSSDLVAALDWVADYHETYQIRIVNMSLGSVAYESVCDSDNQAISEAVDAVKAEGIALFAATGNDGDDTGIDMPACLSSVASVGAVYDADVGSQSYSETCTDPSTAIDQIACFSNVSTVLDLLAPGARITSTGLNGGTTTKSGTSMACPHAAGMAALLLEADPDLNPDELLDRMVETGTLIDDVRIDMTFPRIDAAAALEIDNPDLDEDCDVDGRDLAILAVDPTRLILDHFAVVFGKAVCE